MSTSLLLFHAGTWTLMVLGLAHLVIDFISVRQREQPPVFAIMREHQVEMPGRTLKLFDFVRGYSLLIGILLLAFGALCALVAISAPDVIDRVPLIPFFACGVSAICTALAIRYLFAVPILMSGCACAAFGLSGALLMTF